MSSELKTNKVSPATGTALQIGDSGDTITIPSGATLTNSGSATGFGKVLQVVQAIKSDTTSIQTATLTSTGLEASITPSATSSKVLILINAFIGTNTDVTPYFQINRDSTVLTDAHGDAPGSRSRNTTGSQYQYSAYNNIAAPILHLDSPSSTSALTYKLMWAQYANTYVTVLNRAYLDVDAGYYSRSASTMILMEIAG